MSNMLAWGTLGLAIAGLLMMTSIRDRSFFPLADASPRSLTILAIALILFVVMCVAGYIVVFS